MPEAPTVSVIVPTFNRADYIGTALDSVIAQTARPIEIVVVDDGSTDHTAGIVAGFGSSIGYLHQENQGKVAAIASGLAQVRGDLVWVMDDDDIAPPGALAALRAPFVEDPGLALSYGGMLKFHEREGEIVFGETAAYPVADPRPFFVKLLEDCFVTGHPCVLVRREALEAMRPFDTSVKASVDYYFHLGVARSGRAAFVGETVLWQRQHGGTRGPSASRYAASDRTRRWVEHDARLVGRLLGEIELGEYIGRDGEALDEAETRRALLQRAAIAGRKTLWERALDDFGAALGLLPEVPLSGAELGIVARMLGSRYGIGELHDDAATVAALRRTAEARADGRRILAELSRPLLQRLRVAWRERDPSLALAMLRVWSRLMGPAASGAAIAQSVRRNLRRRRTKIPAGRDRHP